jgi:hypothetical protein
MRLVGGALIFAFLVAGASCSTFPGFDAYHKAAARRAAAGPAAKGWRTAAPPHQAVVINGWPYLFTRSQVRRLRRLGYRFDDKDLKAARLLYTEGYTATDLVQALEDLHRYAAGDRTRLAAIAAYRVAGFDMNRATRYLRSKRTLTREYNHEVIGGTGVWKAGWGLTITGITLVAIAAGILIPIGISLAYCEMESPQPGDEYTECGSIGLGIAAISLFSIAGLGGLLTAIGGITLFVASDKANRRVAARALDKADAPKLRDFRRWRQVAQGTGTAASLSLSPLVTRGGGGLVLRLQF